MQTRGEAPIVLLLLFVCLGTCFQSAHQQLPYRRYQSCRPLFPNRPTSGGNHGVSRQNTTSRRAISRRELMGWSFMATVVCVSGPAAVLAADTKKAPGSKPTSARKKMPVKLANFTSQFEPIKSARKTATHTNSQKLKSLVNATKTFKPVDLKKVAESNTINVTMISTDEVVGQKASVYVDRAKFTRVKVKKLPKWIPKSWRPREVVEIPNSELLLAAVFAGSVTESIRTTALYPLSTIKARIQADPKHQRARTWKRKLQALYLSFLRHVREGDLYAGLVPSLLVTVPASGVYCGVRDVTNRILHGPVDEMTPFRNIEVALLGAFVADVVSLAVRTPADVFATRRQVQQMMPNGTRVDLRDSLRDGIDRLPAAITTDLPYLLIRLFGNWLVTRGNEGLGQYELETIAVACVCAAATTPFDVARTRILINDDSGNGEEQRERSKKRNGVLRTMRNITRESEPANVQNLYAGWIERTAYFGIGRAWFDPIRVIGYLGIRDAVLLRWF